MNDGSLRVIPTNPQEVAETAATMTQPKKDYNEGLDYLKNKELAMAANAFHNALKGWEEEENLHGVANASDQLGDICAERGDFDNAFAHYDRAYKICTDDYDRFSLFALERKKAALLAQLERFDEALAQYWDILDEYTANQDPAGAVATLETMAEIFIKTADQEKAANCYQMIAKTHRNFKHPDEAAEYEAKAADLVA